MASVYRRLFDFTIRRKRTTPKAPTVNVVEKVVDPDMGSGYNYDSLYDWEAAQQGNPLRDLVHIHDRAGEFSSFEAESPGRGDVRKSRQFTVYA